MRDRHFGQTSSSLAPSFAQKTSWDAVGTARKHFGHNRYAMRVLLTRTGPPLEVILIEAR
jgi:hypothetical protein